MAMPESPDALSPGAEGSPLDRGQKHLVEPSLWPSVIARRRATSRTETLVTTVGVGEGCPGLLSSPLTVFKGGAHLLPQLPPPSASHSETPGPNRLL